MHLYTLFTCIDIVFIFCYIFKFLTVVRPCLGLFPFASTFLFFKFHLIVPMRRFGQYLNTIRFKCVFKYFVFIKYQRWAVCHWQIPVSLADCRLMETLKHWQIKRRRKRFSAVTRIVTGGQSVSPDGKSVTDGFPFRWRTDDWRKHWNTQKHWRNKRRLKLFSAGTRIVTKQEQYDTLHKFMCDRAASYVIWLISHQKPAGFVVKRCLSRALRFCGAVV